MTPRWILPIFCLALACGSDTAHELPPDCTRAEPVQLVAGPFGAFEFGRTRDTMFFNFIEDDGRRVTYAGSACGADPVLIADGAHFLPTSIALDPLDDDPTLVCDQYTNRIFGIDLTGERPPELLLPHLRCPGRATKYGALYAGGWGYLRLFADFPDETTAIQLRNQGGNDLEVLDEWIAYTYSSDLHAYEFATGNTIDIPGKVLGMAGRGDYLLWYDYEDIATTTLVNLRARTSIVLGTFDRDATYASDQYIPGFPHWRWGFDPSGKYVYHFPPNLPAEAFDLDGRPLSLPAPGEILMAVDTGVISVTREDGQVYFARPGDTTPTALDVRLAADDDWRPFQYVDDHLERIVDSALLRIDLDGAPARVLATDVGLYTRWLDDRALVTLRKDRALERLDTSTGERTRLAEHVSTYTLTDDGLYYLVGDSADPAERGLWYLSPAALSGP